MILIFNWNNHFVFPHLLRQPTTAYSLILIVWETEFYSIRHTRVEYICYSEVSIYAHTISRHSEFVNIILIWFLTMTPRVAVLHIGEVKYSFFIF